MKIHAIQIGTVPLRTNWRKGVGRGGRRLVNVAPENRPAPSLSL
jgi:hypothetical protein